MTNFSCFVFMDTNSENINKLFITQKIY